MSSPIVSAQNIIKRVDTGNETITIVDDVSIDVNKGESLALVGASGAGKSTLMTLLSGLDVPSQGRVTFMGSELSALNSDERAAVRREHVGFVFQQFLLIPTLTALDNVLLPLRILNRTDGIERAKALLEHVGLQARMNHLPAQLSGGEQQRVALARAFMTQPTILFADEPTGNLDEANAERVVEQMFALNQDHGTTLVIVTHDNQLAHQCDRVVRMQAGRVVVENGQ